MKYLPLFFVPTLLLAACQSPLLSDLATRPGEKLFWDDFSNPGGYWTQYSDPDGMLGYSDGAYRILVQSAGYDLWSVSGQSFGNAQVEADAVRVGGPQVNRFGLICGYRDGDHFYFFIISSDGYYTLGKIESGAAALLGQEMMAYSPYIGQDSRPNHLRLDCIDHTLKGAVNGQVLAVARDDGLSGGDAGLIAGAFEQGGVDISFDNFTVTKPQP
jgi:hypothetical protein